MHLHVRRHYYRTQQFPHITAKFNAAGSAKIIYEGMLRLCSKLWDETVKNTRMHSSRMRIDRSSSHLGKGVCLSLLTRRPPPLTRQPTPSHFCHKETEPVRKELSSGRRPPRNETPPPEQNDRRLWKHYPPSYSYAVGNDTSTAIWFHKLLNRKTTKWTSCIGACLLLSKVIPWTDCLFILPYDDGARKCNYCVKPWCNFFRTASHFPLRWKTVAPGIYMT